MKRLVILGACALSMSLAFAAAPPASTPALAKTPETPATAPALTPAPQAAPVPTPPVQWEYLVISNGKTYFNDPKADANDKVGRLQMSFYGLQEATTLQSTMDTLGKLGWELVGIVGQIGGDQEIVFKRPVNKAIADLEAKFIDDQVKAAVKRAEEQLQRAAAEKGLTAIDLDALAAKQEKEQKEKVEADRIAAVQSKLADAAKSFTECPVTDFKVSYAADGTPTAEIYLDGSFLLTDTRYYHGKAVKELMSRFEAAFAKAAGLKAITRNYNDMFTVSVRMYVNGKMNLIDSDRCYDWALPR